jgi:hypothetical protein
MEENMAKRQQKKATKGIEVIDTTKRKAFTAIIQPGGFGLGIAVENEPGYYPVREFPPGSFKTWDEAGEKANALNTEKFGLSHEDAWRITASSMFAK